MEMEIDLRIAKEAMAFFDVGKQEYLKRGSNLNTDKDGYAFIPIIVNLAFSIELFLKCMLEKSWGHDLEDLFLKIDENERKAILQITIKQVQQLEPDFNESDFWDCLRRNKTAFEDWRYFYQRGKHADVFFLFSFATILHNLISVIMTFGKTVSVKPSAPQ